MNLRFVVAEKLWLVLEDAVMEHVSSNDWSSREFFEVLRLPICRVS